MRLEGTRKVMGFDVVAWPPTALKHVISTMHFFSLTIL